MWLLSTSLINGIDCVSINSFSVSSYVLDGEAVLGPPSYVNVDGC